MDASTANAYLDPALADTRAECERLRAELAALKARRCESCQHWRNRHVYEWTGEMQGTCHPPEDANIWVYCEDDIHTAQNFFCAHWEARDATR